MKPEEEGRKLTLSHTNRSSRKKSGLTDFSRKSSSHSREDGCGGVSQKNQAGKAGP